jgi:transcriptional regulator with XRE-family HTH domain
MIVEDWSAYVRRVAGGLGQLDIAERTGLAQTNIGRWLRGEPVVPKAESVVAFARAFNEPPVEALVAAGYITEEEAGAKARRAKTPLREYSEVELLQEVLGRKTGG